MYNSANSRFKFISVLIMQNAVWWATVGWKIHAIDSAYWNISAHFYKWYLKFPPSQRTEFQQIEYRIKKKKNYWIIAV